MKGLFKGISAGLLGLAIAGTALADATASPEGTQQVTLPTGKTVEAQKFVNPPEGSVEHSLLASMKLIKAGDFDGWIGKWCAAETCVDAATNEQFKRLQLTSAAKTVAQCMTEDGGVLVTRREDSEGGGKRLFVYCGPNRMPAPSSHEKAGEAWKISSFSW